MTVHLINHATVRGQVAAEVRAELARQKIPVRRLPFLLGKSQSYWSRRVNAEQAMDVDDLYALAGLLHVLVSQFFEAVDNENPHPSPDGGSDRVRREGIEPPTRWFLASLAPVEPANVLPFPLRKNGLSPNPVLPRRVPLTLVPTTASVKAA